MYRLLPLAIGAAALVATAASSHAVLIYGLTTANELVSFDTATPSSVTTLGTISQANIVDIDFSPANGRLYGVLDNGSLYTIDLVNAFATLAVTPLTTLTGITDLDFNPAVDRVRLFGATDRNYRIVPDPSAVTSPQLPGTAGTVTDDGLFSNAATTLVGSAYTNNFDNNGGTVLYSIDTDNDALYIHSGAGTNSTITQVGTGLGAGLTVGSNVGFDIGQNGIAYVTDASSLYTVDLVTGLASAPTAVASANLKSIAVSVPEPTAALLGAFGLAGLMLRRRRA